MNYLLQVQHITFVVYIYIIIIDAKWQCKDMRTRQPLSANSIGNLIYTSSTCIDVGNDSNELLTTSDNNSKNTVSMKGIHTNLIIVFIECFFSHKI